MREARLTVDPEFRVGEVDPRLFGSFVEHMGRCVYDGHLRARPPDRPTSDGLPAATSSTSCASLGVTVVRYPGRQLRLRLPTGRTASARSTQRPDPARPGLARRRDQPVRPRRVQSPGPAGRHRADARGQPRHPRRPGGRATCVEYANHPGGTQLSDLRRAHGARRARTASSSGASATRWTGRGRSATRPPPSTAGWPRRRPRRCGWSTRDRAGRLRQLHSAMPTFGSWEATSSRRRYEHVDYISVHAYYEQLDDDLASFLASAVDMDRFIEDVIATADHVARPKPAPASGCTSPSTSGTSGTRARFAGAGDLDVRGARRAASRTTTPSPTPSSSARCSSRCCGTPTGCAVACQAQLVNVIAPISTEPGGPVWKQTTYHPFALTSRYGRGTVLQLATRGPVHETGRWGEVPLLDAVAVHAA